MKFLNLDSPFMTALGKMADLMWLNILTLICCIPIFTIGASLTAMNYMALKIVRDEECYITRGFFKAFKENFRQGTAIWLIFFAVFVILGFDYYIILNELIELSQWIRIGILVLTLFLLFAFLYVFPMQAKFANTVRQTIMNAFVISVLHFVRTILMVVCYVLPFVATAYVQQLIPLYFLFCFSLPAFLCAKLYDKPFKKLEEQILAAQDDDQQAEDEEKIFSDELIIASGNSEAGAPAK